MGNLLNTRRTRASCPQYMKNSNNSATGGQPVYERTQDLNRRFSKEGTRMAGQPVARAHIAVTGDTRIGTRSDTGSHPGGWPSVRLASHTVSVKGKKDDAGTRQDIPGAQTSPSRSTQASPGVGSAPGHAEFALYCPGPHAGLVVQVDVKTVRARLSVVVFSSRWTWSGLPPEADPQ